MKRPSRYRAICAPIIARVLRESRGLPESEVAARLRHAYPFGARCNYPYDVWRSEIRAQGGPPLSRGRPMGTVLPPRVTGRPLPSARQRAKEDWLPVSPESWLPPQVRCRSCAHLGVTRLVTDPRGAKRVRRQCDCSPHGFTDVDWPACPRYQVRANQELPQ